MSLLKKLPSILLLLMLIISIEAMGQQHKNHWESCETYPMGQIVWGPCALQGYDHVPMASDFEVCQYLDVLWNEKNLLNHGRLTTTWKGTVYNLQGKAVPFHIVAKSIHISFFTGEDMNKAIDITVGSIGGVQISSIIRIYTNQDGEMKTYVDKITCVCKN